MNSSLHSLQNDLIANFDPDFVNPTTAQLGRFVIPSTQTAQISGHPHYQFGYVLARIPAWAWGRGTVRMDRPTFSPRIESPTGLATNRSSAAGTESTIRLRRLRAFAIQSLPIPLNQSVTKEEQLLH